ncbi:phage tail sheath subtilisin-like domain-containing protein [soil metagenome]
MPNTPCFPGAYIEELPSGARAITGVATSLAAFVGRTRRGPVNDPVPIKTFADFERIFGGLWRWSPLSFAVRDFYLNGGRQAVVVRLYRPAVGRDVDQEARLVLGTLHLQAAHPGSWANQLRARIDHHVESPRAAALFNLTVRDGRTGATETFRDVSVLPNHLRNIQRVLEQESQLIRTRGPLPVARPAHSGPAPLGVPAAGADPFAAATSAGVAAKGTDGTALTGSDYTTSASAKTGIYALEKTDLFNILCLPPPSFTADIKASTWAAAAAYCEKRRAMLIVDPPADWASKDAAKGDGSATGVAALGTTSKNSAVYFPRLRQPNPLRQNQVEDFAPCGAVAGVWARTETNGGVWKAPAGLEAALVGVPQLSVSLTDRENGELNQLAINCLRSFPAAGRVVWGARTLQGGDRLASEWKYVPVRRLALFVEESLLRGTKWVVLEANDEPLWAQIRLCLGAFMHSLFRQGAFQGSTPREAYFVKCGEETTTPNDIGLGVVNILIGFAPLKPAEFVIIKVQQFAGPAAT